MSEPEANKITDVIVDVWGITPNGLPIVSRRILTEHKWLGWVCSDTTLVVGSDAIAFSASGTTGEPAAMFVDQEDEEILAVSLPVDTMISAALPFELPAADPNHGPLPAWEITCSLVGTAAGRPDDAVYLIEIGQAMIDAAPDLDGEPMLPTVSVTGLTVPYRLPAGGWSQVHARLRADLRWKAIEHAMDCSGTRFLVRRWRG